MHDRPRVTVVGSYNTDLVVRTPRMPVQGETILGGPYRTGPGGKGANQAVAAARLGADVHMVAKLGTDDLGDQAAANLQDEEIDSGFVLRTDATHTGVAFIIVDDTGENLIVVAPGANTLLAPRDVEGASEAVVGADIVLVQLEVPMETVEHTIRMAHGAGVRVLLNPAPGQALSDELLSMVDVLTPNETEAQTIVGHSVQSTEQVQSAAEELLGMGVGIVVATLGAKGALLVTDEGTEMIPGKDVDVVDTTGAGDAFNGALAVALAEGQPLADAVAFANAAAALQVTKVGTAPAMPYRDRVEAFLAG